LGVPREGATAPAWSSEDIALAQARCSALLKDLSVVAAAEDPIREGGACGTPAPMRLISIGKSPQIALSPPPTVTCDLIAALHRWLQQEVQPLARKHLGAPVIRVETMSSYACRNAYGRATSRLSEHGRANALDIRAFVTAQGQTAQVVADWGPTAREIAAATAADEKPTPSWATEPAEPLRLAADSGLPPKKGALLATGDGRATLAPGLSPTLAPAASGPAVPLSGGIPGLAIEWLRPPDPGALPALTPASRLGGPGAAPAAAPAHGARDGAMDKTAFLRDAHRAACRIFGTVLGPEANTQHKNHFHVDMAERKVTIICE
jgi:hypothetical protein